MEGPDNFEELAQRHEAKEDTLATLRAIDLRVKEETGSNLELMQQAYQRLFNEQEPKTKSRIKSRIMTETGTDLGNLEGVQLVDKRTGAEWNNLLKDTESYEGGLQKRINDIETEIQRRRNLQKKFTEITDRLKPLWDEESRIAAEIKELEEVHHLDVPPSLRRSLDTVRAQIEAQTKELGEAFPGSAISN